MQQSSQPFDTIHSVDLQALSKMRNDQGPVFSLFLNQRPEKQTTDDLLARFDSLLRQAEQKKKLDQNPGSYRQQWADEAKRVRDWLKTMQPLQHQGLALFSSQAAGIRNAFLLHVPVSDRLVATDRPYARPLEIMLGEFNCSLVVLIDEETARLVKVYLGDTQEIANVQAVPVTGSSIESGFQEHARSIAERVQDTWQELDCAHLVIGGSDEPLTHLRDALPETLRAHLTGEIDLSPQAGLEEIQARLQEMEGEQEQRLEELRVEQLIASAGEGDGKTAVLGMEQALLAVRAKKVRLLAAEEDFHQEGGECPNCGYLGEWEQGFCLFCEMALRPEPDIIEAALKRVLDQGGEIDVLRSPVARRALEPHGRIGALLYAGGSKPAEKNSSNQATIASHGKIHPEAVHDEAVDESFPASDPPGW